MVRALALAGFDAPSADTRRAIQSCDLAIVESDHVKCLHALSSFQRTGSPAKPDGFAAPQRCYLSLAEVPTFSTPRGRFWGNLSRLQPDPTLVKPYFHLRNTVQRLDWDRLGNLAYPEGGPPLLALRCCEDGAAIRAGTLTARVTTAQRTYES